MRLRVRKRFKIHSTTDRIYFPSFYPFVLISNEYSKDINETREPPKYYQSQEYDKTT